jgi:hypothetical protein
VVLSFLMLLLATGQFSSSGPISARTWTFLVLSGLGTGASWLCYFRALKLGPATLVAPIDKLSVVLVALFAFAFLGERPSAAGWLGICLIAGRCDDRRHRSVGITFQSSGRYSHVRVWAPNLCSRGSFSVVVRCRRYRGAGGREHGDVPLPELAGLADLLRTQGLEDDEDLIRGMQEHFGLGRLAISTRQRFEAAIIAGET